MAFEENDTEPGVEEAGPPPEESSNRSFLIIAGVLVGILLLSLLCLGGYALIRLPQLRASRATDAAKAIEQATQMQLSVAQTGTAQMVAQAFTATPSPTRPVPTATRTPVVAVGSTNTAAPATIDPRTPTMAALLTQVAANTTPVATATLLPNAGIADELITVNLPMLGVITVGLPAFLGLVVVLVGVAFVSRWLRKK